MKKIIILILLVLALGIVWFGFLKDEKVTITPTPLPTETEEKITYIKASTDLIVVDLPYPGAVTGKEFSVIGRARGYWFFEASFPLQLLCADGKVLANGYAEAQPDPVTGEVNWMTENFVPFKGEIKAPESYIGPATLILRKDNASGLPEHDASISFPITVEY